MLIKIQCECGTRYKFDVEPVDGQMPVKVECPFCSADGTDEANRLIREQLGLAPLPAKPKVEVPKPFKAQAASPAKEGKSPLKLVEKEKRPPQQTVTLPPQGKKVGDVCIKHNEPTVDTCFYCKKTICPSCMRKHGYFCSDRCRHEAEGRGMKIPVFQGHEMVIHERKMRRIKWVAGGAAAALVLLFFGWVWIKYVASRPSVKVSVPLEDGDRVQLCSFLSKEELLVATDKELRLYDAASGKVRWTASLASYQAPELDTWLIEDETEREKAFEAHRKLLAEVQSATAKLTPNEQAFLQLFRTHAPPKIKIEGVSASYSGRPGEIWGEYPGKLVVFDWSSGSVKKVVDLFGEILRLDPEDSVIFVTADSARPNHGKLTRVDLKTGSAESAEIRLPQSKWQAPREADRIMGTGQDEGSAVLGELAGLPDAMASVTSSDDDLFLEKHRLQFVPAGPNVAEFEVTLKEKKVLSHQIVKPEDIKPKEELGASGPVKVTDAAALAQEMIYEQVKERGGISVKEDLSRYEVRLARLLAKDAPEWKGMMDGRPMFYPLQTVDAVVSGKQVVVFDKANKKLWEGALAAAVVQSDDPAVVPCLEDRGNLYVLDAQTLHCFDVKTGEARWRLPGPGMSMMNVDPDGQIYVKVNDTLKKIEASKGKELWSMDIFAKVDGSPGRLGALGVLRGLGMGSREADFTLVGGDLYLFKAQVSSHDVLQHLSMGKDLPTHFRIVRISPKSGEIKWEHYTPRAPAAMDILENRIAIVYPTVYKRDPNNHGKWKGEGGELQILSYLNW